MPQGLTADAVHALGDIEDEIPAPAFGQGADQAADAADPFHLVPL
jgi:hypothetical protein